MIINKQELLCSGTCIRARKLALAALEAALAAGDPKFSLDDFDSIYVIGAGKAVGRMAEALFDILDYEITIRILFSEN